MSKRTIILTVVALLIISALLLYFIPNRITRFDESMEAVKVDGDGNVLCTVSFRVQASRKDYLFRQSQFSYWIPEFDSLSSITFERDVPILTAAYCHVPILATSSTAGNSVTCDLFGSPELDRWLFWNRNENTFYVASPNANDSASDLLQYFSELVGDLRIPTTVK